MFLVKDIPLIPEVTLILLQEAPPIIRTRQEALPVIPPPVKWVWLPQIHTIQ